MSAQPCGQVAHLEPPTDVSRGRQGIEGAAGSCFWSLVSWEALPAAWLSMPRRRQAANTVGDRGMASKGRCGSAAMRSASGVGVHRRVARPAIDRRAAWALLLLLLLRRGPVGGPATPSVQGSRGGCSASLPLSPSCLPGAVFIEIASLEPPAPLPSPLPEV